MQDLTDTINNMEYKVKKKEREIEADFLREYYMSVKSADEMPQTELENELEGE